MADLETVAAAAGAVAAVFAVFGGLGWLLSEAIEWCLEHLE